MSFPFPRFLCLLLLQLPFFASAQPYSNVSLNSSLSTRDRNPYWTSPSGDFAFGFRPHQGFFLLAIWFAKITVENETIVWTANGGNPVESGSTVELTSKGVLTLKTPNGTEAWKAQTADSSQVAYAAMLNTGNFVLASTESTTVWASFNNPTDTILPTQNLQFGTQLRSRVTQDDYRARGKFLFSFQTDGNLVMYTLALPLDMALPVGSQNAAYWASNTVNNGSQLIFNQTGNIYLTLRSGGVYNLPSSSQIPDPTRSYYRRATLDYDGVFRQYTYPQTLPSNGRWPSSWSTSWSLPENICERGVCGVNSYCRLNINQRPQCECPPGYMFIDPNNTFRGCEQNFLPQICGKNGSKISDGFEMQELLSTDWPFADYETFKLVSEDWCSETCLNDCFCAAAITGDDNCWLKKFPLSRGRMTVNRKALIKVGDSSLKNVPPASVFEEKDEKENKWVIPVSSILGISVVFNLLLLVLIIYRPYRKKNIQTQMDIPHMSAGSSGVNLWSFTYKELEDATDGFKEELGRGAFSTVYKGVLKSDSGLLVAVKRLDNVVQGNDKEFKAEMNAIGKTNHKNLVRLLGFCDEGTHRLLVYEFMRNGSLENFLFGDSILDWNQRIKIAFGIARGLAYLHEDCSSQIIHCDIKPQNILLDDSYVARISDFGLAKLLMNEQTRTITGIRGTRGYVAPEWFKNMAITAKVDVYSFGIMLLEIVCCRKNAKQLVGEEDVEILSDLAYECCAQKALHILVMNDEAAKNDGKNLEKLVMVALWCIQEDPSVRPSMKKVTQMLEGAADVSMPPDPESFMSSIG
ncbi:non-specific serine/threonine protein kinase [Ranunculus cassubicifolius]